jgi:1-acyl-sn-glycerol-3-phosphate acyltransferase
VTRLGVMRWMRAAFRLLAIVLVTAIVCLKWAIASAFAVRSPRLRQKIRHVVFQSWSWLMLRILGARVVVRGTPPARPFFLVSNHLSYLDIPVLASHAPGVFVAKKEIRSWPVIGFLCACMGTIFIDRSSRRDIPRVLERLEREMSFGEGVMIFPEGTSSDGSSILPFRPPLLEAASVSDVPVSCAALRYETRADSPPPHLSVCWWGGMNFTSHLLRLLTLPGFRAEISFGDQRVGEKDRKLLAEALWQQVNRLFDPVTAQRNGDTE